MGFKFHGVCGTTSVNIDSPPPRPCYFPSYYAGRISIVSPFELLEVRCCPRRRRRQRCTCTGSQNTNISGGEQNGGGGSLNCCLRWLFDSKTLNVFPDHVRRTFGRSQRFSRTPNHRAHVIPFLLCRLWPQSVTKYGDYHILSPSCPPPKHLLPPTLACLSGLTLPLS